LLVNLSFKLAQPRLKIVDSVYAVVHASPGVSSTQRSVGETPISRIEAEALVNHDRSICQAPSLEDDLSSIGIASPFVKNEHSRKIRQIVHLAEQRVWENI